MHAIRSNEITPELERRYQSFIVFEPASVRVQDADVLIRGDRILELYQRLSERLNETNDLKLIVIRNRIIKVGQMLSLLNQFENTVMTKFFDRIWRRYTYISNIGELFLDARTFLEYFPEFKKERNALFAQRLDEDEDFDAAVEEEEVVPAVGPDDLKAKEAE